MSNILSFARPMPSEDDVIDSCWIGNNEKLVRYAEAASAHALCAIWGILELDGRHNWYEAQVEVLARFGVACAYDLKDGPLVARIARALHLREELAICNALNVIEGKVTK